MAKDPKEKVKNNIAEMLNLQNLKGRDVNDIKGALSPAAIAGVVEQMYPGMGRLIGRIMDFSDGRAMENSTQSGPQSDISDGAKQKIEDIFKDKENLKPEDLSAAVSKELANLEDEGVLKFPSDAARREFMNNVSNAVYRAEDGKRVAAVAKSAIDYAKTYGVDVKFEAEVKADLESKSGNITYEANQEVRLTQTQLLDITPMDTGGWMNAYKVGADGHMVEQGNIRIAEVMQGVGLNPTITLLTQENSAVNTEGLVGHKEMPNGAFVALKGEDGTTYYTDLSSLPGLGTDKGKDIWNQMKQEAPEPGLGKGPSPMPGVTPKAVSPSTTPVWT